MWTNLARPTGNYKMTKMFWNGNLTIVNNQWQFSPNYGG